MKTKNKVKNTEIKAGELRAKGLFAIPVEFLKGITKHHVIAMTWQRIGGKPDTIEEMAYYTTFKELDSMGIDSVPNWFWKGTTNDTTIHLYWEEGRVHVSLSKEELESTKTNEHHN